MAVRPIVRLGHPALRTTAEPLEPERIAGEEIQRLVDDLIETMVAARGFGLAAPQLGIGLALFVWRLSRNGPGGVPAVVLNPMLTPQPGDLVYDWEGCLSIPELRGLVPRHPAVRLVGLDREGKPIDRVVEGFESRVVQHEFDHLNGMVYLDRMRDLKSLAYAEELETWLGETASSPQGAAVG